MQQLYWTSRACASRGKSRIRSGRKGVVMTEKKGFTGSGSLKTNLIAIVAFLLFTAGAQIFFTVQAISDLRGLPETVGTYSNGRYLAERLLYLTSTSLSTGGLERQRAVEAARQVMKDIEERYRGLRQGASAGGGGPARDARGTPATDG